MPLKLQEINKKSVGFFNFKELNGQYLLTNDIGGYCFLEPPIFNTHLCGKIERAYPKKFSELQTKGFVRSKLDFDSLSRRYASRNAHLGQGPGLHIVVATLRCDHKCIYCQAGSGGLASTELDMSRPIAQKVVDRIFESPNLSITIEFQGGEPLVNFEIIKFIVGYARNKNVKHNKNLLFSVVSNLSFLNARIVEFLVKNNIHICTSLDGPENIHNKCRLSSGINSYKNTVKWIRVLIKEFNRVDSPIMPSALATVTRFSLRHPRKIVDEYIRLGLRGVHLRPLNPFAISHSAWKRLSFSADDFVVFYARAVDYILELNRKGKYFHERFAAIFLAKILGDIDPNYLDIRSPCGAGIGQLAYNYNGDVYTCDEGRMLSRRGENAFKLGNAVSDSYKDFISSPTVKAMCLASCLDNFAGCSQCVYKPYCGVCPLYNYSLAGDIFAKSAFLCRIHAGILDYLFTKLQDDNIKDIFYKWGQGRPVKKEGGRG